MNRRYLLSLLAAGALYAQSGPTMFPPVRGTREMVAAANNQEVEAGYRILMAGGNAVDAGVASVLAAAVTEQSRFGLGGEMPLLIKLKDKPPIAVSGVGTAPALATVDYYTKREREPWEQPGKIPPVPMQGIRAAIVPGVFDGLILALQKYGTKSFAEVSAPAIEYAEGFPIAEEFAGMLRGYEPILSSWPASKLFFYPNGVPPKRGEIVRMQSLANTLRDLAKAEKKARGNRQKKLEAVHNYFYKGDLAKKLAAFSEQNGGLIRYDDLAKFRAEEDRTRSWNFRGYEVHKPGFWTQGPVMLEALQILDGYDLKSMGHNSAEYLHTVVEAVKLAFADRDRYYGDPKFSTIAEERLLSTEYAAQRRAMIDPNAANNEHRPGDFGTPLKLKATETGENVNDTTCVNVVDRFGNAFSATPSGAWLPSVIAGETGIPFSTRLQTFVMTEGHPNQLAPGKRPRVTLSPTLVTKDGKVAFVMSTPGGDNQDQAMLQVLLNLIVFGMTPQEAVEAPRFQTEHFYGSFADHVFNPGKLNLEARISKAVADKLQSLGHKVSVTGNWSNSSAPTVIFVDNGVLNGGADPRRARFVFGR